MLAIADASSRALPGALRLLPGSELLGRVEGSALREAPSYVRRPDGQVVQLSALFYAIARYAEPGRSLDEIARLVGAEMDVRLSPDQVRYVLEAKLYPLGVVAGPDGAAPTLQRLDPLLALKHRVGVLSPRVVDAMARVLHPLFQAPVAVAVLAILAAFDVWLFAIHGLHAGLTQLIATPALGMMLFVISYASLAWHELGHAAACRHGGGRPGAIGIGLYVVWPVFYTDVTDAYRFGRRGRLRVDVGGVYFNALFAVALAAAYGATGFEPLLLAVAAQHMLVFDQFAPWLLDGYYVVADAIGVSDLFSRIGPVLRSLRPGRGSDPRVAELKPWARFAVTAWVMSTVLILVGFLVLVVTHAPQYIERAWSSLFVQADAAQGAIVGGQVASGVASGLNVVFLVLPVVALLLTYVLLCRGLGARLAARVTRRQAAAHPAARTAAG